MGASESRVQRSTAISLEVQCNSSHHHHHHHHQPTDSSGSKRRDNIPRFMLRYSEHSLYVTIQHRVKKLRSDNIIVPSHAGRRLISSRTKHYTTSVVPGTTISLADLISVHSLGTSLATDKASQSSNITSEATSSRRRLSLTLASVSASATQAFSLHKQSFQYALLLHSQCISMLCHMTSAAQRDEWIDTLQLQIAYRESTKKNNKYCHDSKQRESVIKEAVELGFTPDVLQKAAQNVQNNPEINALNLCSLLDAAGELAVIDFDAFQSSEIEPESALDVTLCEMKEQEIEWNLCRRCYAAQIDGVILDCAHYAFCYECALEMFTSDIACPYCKTKIVAVVKTDVLT